jgi:hypothetical protein
MCDVPPTGILVMLSVAAGGARRYRTMVQVDSNAGQHPHKAFEHGERVAFDG